MTAELVAAHLPDGCSLVDLGPHRLKDAGAPERIRALKGPGVRTPPPATECPYRGLLAFEPDDRALLLRPRGGRRASSSAASRPGRLLAVVGASGSGKSSVLRAGLVAAARPARWPGSSGRGRRRRGAEPELDCADELSALVVVDQFEELFALCDDAGRREAFIDALLALRCPVAIGVRADLYGRLGAHAELARAVAANQVLLGAMTAAELERAVDRAGAPRRAASSSPASSS